MRTALADLVRGLELAFALAGAILLWRLVLSPSARAARVPARLKPWVAPAPDFAIFLLFVLAGFFIGPTVGSLIARALELRGDTLSAFLGAGAQFGMLAGAALYWTRPEHAASAPALFHRDDLAAGAATFLIAMPVLIAVQNSCEALLKLLGLPTEKQELIGMFANADSAWLLASMLSLAIVIAPLAEELVFRAGFFRYFHARLPRWAALLIPAVIFGVPHVNWQTLQGLSAFVPLIVLAVIFSLAYERTGRLGTSIVAHALFNLNTVILIFSGAAK